MSRGIDMWDYCDVLGAIEDYHGNWTALGRTFRRKGQAEKFIRRSGYKVGLPLYYGYRWDN